MVDFVEQSLADSEHSLLFISKVDSVSVCLSLLLFALLMPFCFFTFLYINLSTKGSAGIFTENSF